MTVSRNKMDTFVSINQAITRAIEGHKNMFKNTAYGRLIMTTAELRQTCVNKRSSTSVREPSIPLVEHPKIIEAN